MGGERKSKGEKKIVNISLDYNYVMSTRITKDKHTPPRTAPRRKYYLYEDTIQIKEVENGHLFLMVG